MTRTETFDIVTQPWIPVRHHDGTTTEMGLRDVLRHAHELDEITHESAMIEYSLHRFLITFIMDALRPQTGSELADRIEEGSFDMEEIDNYLDVCRGEGVTFDLFDSARPFLQTAYEENFEKTKSAVSVLDYSQPRGNNHVHFVHPEAQQRSLSFAEAAQLLPTLQVFCTIGGRGYAAGINGSPPYYALIRGDNLFETLLYSTPVSTSFHNLEYDDPAVLWRSQAELSSTKPVLYTSILGGMLFPARRVHLFPRGDQCVSAYFGPGLKFKSDSTAPTWLDPHAAYLETKKGKFPWGPQKSRGVWRNIAQLAYPENAPAIVSVYTSIAPAGKFIQLQLYGAQTDQASFLHSMRESVQLPKRLTDDTSAADMAVKMVKDAENVAYRLRKSLDVSAGASGSIIGTSLQEACVQQFYDRCGEEFWQQVGRLGSSGAEQNDKVHLEWAKCLADYAKQTRSDLLQSVQVDTEDLFVLEEAGNRFAAYLGGMIKKIRRGENSK